MSTCNVQTLSDSAACFADLPARQVEIIKAVLLCKILQALNPMATCDVQTLLNDAACFADLPRGFLEVIQTQLLCEIKENIGGSSSACNFSGAGDPVADPGCTTAFYVNTTDGSFWYWTSGAGVWTPLIQ